MVLIFTEESGETEHRGTVTDLTEDTQGVYSNNRCAEAQKGQLPPPIITEGQTQPDRPSGSRFGVNVKSHQTLVSRAFYSPQALQERLQFLSCLEVFAPPWTPYDGFSIQAIRHTHIEAFLRFFDCNSDGH
ncbi:hypothetical protein H920_06063 [Fukomys damarensis]|uniref:Uncharacterized protein n=1 Tax=Fukomys damarensis TaxID=885580 RepID=A0A091DN26_FUKDA|nr:hypothetical protein H920_06063 [Fukomys damarensis]